MDLIRVSSLFTTLLHCVLAYSLPSNNLHQTSGPYSTMSHSFGILEIPSHNKDSQTEATFFYVNPRRPLDNKMSFEAKTQREQTERNKTQNREHLPQPEVPGATLKGIEPKHPLAMPRVKLNFVGTSGMLPVKTHTLHSDKTEPAKELKPTNSDKSTKPMNAGINDTVDWLKSIFSLSSIPVEYPKQDIMPHDDLTTPVSQYKEISQKTFHSTPSDQPSAGWNAGILLNPMNIYQTNPRVEERKDLDDKQYTPPYNVLPGLVTRPYPTSINGNVEPVRNNQYSSTYKLDYPIDTLQPTNGNYPTNEGLYGNAPERADQYTPYVPEIKSKLHDYSKKENSHLIGATQSTPYKENLPVNVVKSPIVDHSPNKPVGKEEIVLPPVPTSLSLLQRQQIILLNTVAGLPGGNSAVLDAVRAG